MRGESGNLAKDTRGATGRGADTTGTPVGVVVADETSGAVAALGASEVVLAVAGVAVAAADTMGAVVSSFWAAFDFEADAVLLVPAGRPTRRVGREVVAGARADAVAGADAVLTDSELVSTGFAAVTKSAAVDGAFEGITKKLLLTTCPQLKGCGKFDFLQNKKMTYFCLGFESF